MSVGLQLLRAILDGGDPTALDGIIFDLFVEEERPVLQRIQRHMREHGALPSPDTLRRDHGVGLPEAPEPTSYYRDRVRRRAMFNAWNYRMREINDALRNRDPDRVLQIATEACEAMLGVGGAITTDPQSIERIREKMGGSTLAELRESEIEASPEIVHGVIAPGLTLLAGDPKCGKSWLAMELSLAVATGRPALGSLPVSQGPVLHLALEDTRQSFKERCELMEIDQWPETVEVFFECDPLDQGGLDNLKALVVTSRPRMIIIDTFAKVRREADERKPIQQREYGDLQGLKAIADAHDVAIVLLLHTNKQKGQNPIARTAGSHGFTGGADNVLLLSREERAGTLNVTGRRIAESRLNLTQDPETMRWRATGQNAAVELQHTEEAVLRYLWQHGTAAPADIIRGTRIARRTLEDALRRMDDRGLLARDGPPSSRRIIPFPEQIVRRVSCWMWPGSQLFDPELPRRPSSASTSGSDDDIVF
jgi:hypothetical protein